MKNEKAMSATHEAAQFWYDMNQYIESICLLAEAMANQLAKDGYNPIFPSYGLGFVAVERNRTRLVYDNLKHYWAGQFAIGDPEEQQENIVYGSGISFGLNNPHNAVEPWIPLVYLFKAKLKEHQEWNVWEHPRILFTPQRLLAPLACGGTYIACLSNAGVEAIEEVNVLRFPLGAVCTTDDVAKIIRPGVEALRHDDEKLLSGLEEYLLSIEDKWKE